MLRVEISELMLHEADEAKCLVELLDTELSGCQFCGWVSVTDCLTQDVVATEVAAHLGPPRQWPDVDRSSHGCGEVDKPVDPKRNRRPLTEPGTSHFQRQAKLTTMRFSEHRTRA